MVPPAVPLALDATFVTTRSASCASGVAAVAVLLAKLLSAVVVVTVPLNVCTVVEPSGTAYVITVTVLEPLARLPTAISCVAPLGSVTVAATAVAVLGPALLIVTVAVIDCPGV